MWQRPLVIFKPNPIAHVDIAAAERAFPEMLGLAQWRATDLPSDDCAARARFIEVGDFHLMFRSKKSGPGITPEARPIRRAVYIRPCCHLNLYCHDEGRCQTLAAYPAVQRTISASALDVRHSASDCGGHGSANLLAQTEDVRMKKSVAIAAATFFWAAFCFPNVCVSQTIYAFGVGTDSCGAYIAHIAAAPGKSVSRTAPDDRQDYYSKSTTYLEWLLGFITGYNAALSDPKKQIQLDTAAVDLHVRNWCGKIRRATFLPPFINC
jgi:hypothetical protein